VPAIVVRDLPPAIHQRLKQEAERHHRSMNREIIAILEKELGATGSAPLPEPVQLKKAVDPRWIADMIREARDKNPFGSSERAWAQMRPACGSAHRRPRRAIGL